MKSRFIIALMAVATAACTTNSSKTGPDDAPPASQGGRATTGGAQSTGGVSGTGGMPGAGGVSETGGASATGGTSSADGTQGTGGASSTGGARASGGTVGTGGVVMTGGATGNRDAALDSPDVAMVDTRGPDVPLDTGTGDDGAAPGCGSSTPPPASVTVGGVAYNLNWSDEFNGTELDGTHWNNTATWCCGQGTNLAQNAYLTGGCLELKAAQATGGGYTSAWIDTEGKYTFTRGYIEIRARLPKGQGMWPALWMDEASGNPAAEFDIMEMLGNAPTTIYETNHLWPSGGGSGTQVHQCTWKGPDFSAGFHVFGFQIQATQITWYVDGAQTCTTNQGVNVNPVYHMLNTAVGGAGSWPGAPDQTTVFPNYLDIDYVRVYQ
jgi:Glycosyl hydrolases family 16